MSASGDAAIELGVPGISEAERIGAGGFGVVYRAVEAELGRIVAVKVLSGNLTDDDRFRFDRERRAMGTLSDHPNIVTIYRSGYAEAGNAYLVMEYLPDGSLKDQIQPRGALPWADVLRFGVQLSGALETAHRAGVLHRDVKPANVLLSRLGSAKLCDFGIARLQGAPETQGNVITASVAHAPPEILNGERASELQDVYSLASTMYELITGSAPFWRSTDESVVPVLARIQQDPVPPFPADQLPTPLAETLHLAMSKDPAARPQSALAFGELLSACEDQLGVAHTPIPIASSSTSTAATQAGSWPPPTVPVSPSQEPAPTPEPEPATEAAPEPAPTPEPAPDAAEGGATHTVPLAGAGPAQPATPAPEPAAAAAVGPASAPAVQPDVTGPLGAPVNRGRSQVLLAAGVGAVVLVVAGLAWLGLRGGDDDEIGLASADVGQTDDDNGDPAATTVPGRGAEGGDYEAYVLLEDSTGAVSVLVPDEWTDIERGPGANDLPFVAAAPQLEDAFYDSYAGPGLSVSVENGVVFDLGGRLDAMAIDDCAGTGREDVFSPYRGMLEVFRNCGNTQTELIHVVFVDADSNQTVEMRIQLVDQRDVTAASTAADSLTLLSS